MWRSFRRLEAPRLMETAAFGQSKCLATSPISSALALPSAGGERSSANQAPDASLRSALSRAPGLTFTSMNRRGPDIPRIFSWARSAARAAPLPDVHEVATEESTSRHTAGADCRRSRYRNPNQRSANHEDDDFPPARPGLERD